MEVLRCLRLFDLAQHRGSGQQQRPVCLGAEESLTSCFIQNAAGSYDLSGAKLRTQSADPSCRDQNPYSVLCHCLACEYCSNLPDTGTRDDKFIRLEDAHGCSMPHRASPDPLHEGGDLAGHCRDHADAGRHAAFTYPWARNQSMARCRAASTGDGEYPRSRFAFSEDAHIFFLPIFTDSTVARGSLPRSLPVMVSSNAANAMATEWGTRMLGLGSPVSAASLSSSCLSVTFSPPTM